MSFGAVVRTRHTELGIGLNDLALRLGVSSGYWSRVERGHEEPPREDLVERAAAILGVTMDSLFVEARRLPPDMWRDIARVVETYRRLRAVRAS